MADRVILVLARTRDEQARKLVERWPGHGAILMTPDDLSVAGWRYRVDDADSCTAIAGGHPISMREICGVVIRLPWVVEQDIAHIIRADRPYVASEMNAFLLSWLCALKCPVLNRPTPNYLLGPCWRHEKWVHTAAMLGIPVTTAHSNVFFGTGTLEKSKPEGIAMTIVGRRCIGDVDRILAKQARSLADAAGVDLLTVRFSESGSFFTGADFWPDTITDNMAEAILEYFREDP